MPQEKSKLLRYIFLLFGPDWLQSESKKTLFDNVGYVQKTILLKGLL